MKTILATTDFSATSINAVYYAADMAKALELNLSLLHVCEIPQSFNQLSMPVYNADELLSSGQHKLDELKQQVYDYSDKKIKIKTSVMLGDVVASIEDECAEVNPFAVVMGAETMKGIERILFGGKTLAALNRLSWPLIVVPVNIKFNGIKKAALACDLKDVEKYIPVKQLTNILNVSSSELFVLHVNPESRDSFSEEINDQAGKLHKLLGKLKPKYRFLNGIDITKGISDFVIENKIDLLIVIPKKHDVVTKIFRTSCSKELVLSSQVPVLSIH